MDIKDYARIIKKNWIALITVIVVFVLATYLFTAQKAPTFEASATIEVVRSQELDQGKAPYYLYDSYYTGLAASSLSDNMLGWLSSASTVGEVFQGAGYEIPSGDSKTLAKVFTAKKKLATSAVVDVSYTSTDQVKAGKLIGQATQVLKEKIDQYNQVDSAANFNSIVSAPVVIEVPKTYTINLLIAAFVGVLVGLSYAFVRESLTK